MREEVLNAKAEELKAQLTEWASQAGVLAPGQILIFSLRIEQGIAVRRDEHDEAPEQLVPSPQMRAYYDFIAPARLTDGETEELLAQISGHSHCTMSTLLKLNQNAPLRIFSKREIEYELDYKLVNSKLGSHPIRGQYHRLIKKITGRFPKHEYWCQLWEVRKKVK